MTAPEVVSRVWRDEAARLVAGLVRMTHDLALAEDLAQDALVSALEQWPESGVPDNPGAWLMAVSKRRAIDHFRRAARQRSYAPSPPDQPDLDAAVDHIEDDVLRLMFVACHPVLGAEARAALTLRLVGGLSTREIARAYLTSEATVAQRISRAKRTLAEAGVPFEVPSGPERPARLASVLEVVYLIFNEGYAATAGDSLRPELCTEAIRLGGLLASLAPREPEVHGLLALMRLQASRMPARVDPHGSVVLLRDQDRSRWDASLIAAGLASLAEASGNGPYTVQAEIAACHASAESVESTDWVRIASLYFELASVTGSAVVELNRAVAVAEAYGPAAGLELVDSLADLRGLRGYHLLPSVRGDLLARLGRSAEAAAEFSRAAELATNPQDRALLRRRAGR